MKYLKQFENNNIEKTLKSVADEHSVYCDLIKDFINIEKLWEDLYKKEITSVTFYYYEHDFAVVGDETIIAVIEENYLSDDENIPIAISEDMFDKLYKFIENPELYKNSKKFNV